MSESWKHWKPSSGTVPSLEFTKDLPDDEARGALKKLLKAWARKKKPDPKAFDEIVSRTRWVTFPRRVVSGDDPLYPTASFALRDSDRIEAYEIFAGKNPLYCVGCRENLESRDGIVSTKVTFMGFVGEIDAQLKIGVRMTQKTTIHGYVVDEPYVPVSLEDLKFDFDSLDDPTQPEALKAFPRPPSASSSSSSSSSSPGGEVEPSNFVYVFGWDPPGVSDKSAMKRMDLENKAIEKAKVLCDVSKGVRPPEWATLRSKEAAERDRVLLHFFVLLMCWSPELAHWFVSAETSLLKKKLELLCEPYDVAYTIKAARLRKPEDADIDFWRDAPSFICSEQERRLYVALEHARKDPELPHSIGNVAARVVGLITSTLDSWQ